MVLPDELAGSFGVILAYGGSWCSRCNAQLASFQQLLPKLHDADISVVAFSIDDEDHAWGAVGGRVDRSSQRGAERAAGGGRGHRHLA